MSWSIDHDDRESWWFLGPVLVIVWLGAATVDWILEHGINPGIHNFGDALTWVLITATTVGHADVTPVTAPGRILGGLLAFMGIGLLGAASARLTATWLGQGSSDDAVGRELCLVRSELASLRDALQVGAADRPAAGGDGAPTARLSGDGRAIHDRRWHLVGRQVGGLGERWQREEGSS